MATATGISESDIILDLSASTKPAVLEALALEAARRSGLSGVEILKALQQRELLGSTAIGRGVAVPHARLEGDLPPVILFARLHRPVDFDARDDEPVDLLVMILWPAASPEGLLPTLSEACRSLRDPETLKKLRRSQTAKDVSVVLNTVRPATARD